MTTHPAIRRTWRFIGACRGLPGVNGTHTSAGMVLLFCDSVKQRNVLKLNRFHSWCKSMSATKPVCKKSVGWGFTPRPLPTIPPPSASIGRA